MTRRIVLGVTIDDSLQFLKGFPDALVCAGWEVHVVCSPGWRSEALRGKPSIVVHALEMDRDPRPVRDLRALMAWRRLIRKIRPDVVYVGTPKAGLLGIIASAISLVPKRVYLLRGLRLETARGMTASILWFLERLTMSLATDVIAVSKSLQSEAISRRLVRRDHIAVLGAGSSNGVDLERFAPQVRSSPESARLRIELGIDENVPVIGFVGRLTRDKGLYVLADALRYLGDESRAVQLLVVGELDYDTGDEALTTLRASGVRLIETGYQSSPQGYYHLMTVLCHPSYREGFANVILEAAASGIPVVGSNATGVRDAIIDRVTGLIADTGDARVLAARLSEVLDNPESAKKMGHAARQWASEYYAREDVQKRYLDAIIQSNSTGRRLKRDST